MRQEETIAPKSSQLNPFSTNIIYRPLVMSEALDQPLEVVIAEKRGAARGRGPRQARGVLASSREDRAAARWVENFRRNRCGQLVSVVACFGTFPPEIPLS
jgi:hypothetical protein